MATQSGTSGSSGSTLSGKGTASQGTGQGEQGAEQDTPNVTYDLISVIYHALQGCETYEMYADDAEQTGRSEIAQFFREAMEQDQARAERGQEFLMQCMQDEMGQRGGRGRSSQQMQSGGSSGQLGGGQSGGTAGGSGSGSGGGAGRGSGGTR